jgi:FkbM family methyltransferase
VLDVGAHKGNWARRLRRGGYTGRIVSFEPTPAALGRLRARAERDPDWQVRAVALGAEDGETTMHVAPGTFSSLLQANRFGERRYAELQATEAITVPVRRLDGLLDELVAGIAEPRVYLKLDTQGFDVQVFAGLGDRAGDLVGMQSEVAVMPIYEGAPRLTEAVAVYEAAGFEIAAMWPVTRQRRTGRIVEYDCVLVRAKALPR